MAAKPRPALAAMDLPLRVRYAECDPMGVAHHSVYPVWLEIARTELLRRAGRSYRGVEASGVRIVVARLAIRYRRPARYDDSIVVHVRLLESAGVKIEHDYRVRRGDEVLAEAETTVVCVDAQGRLQAIPPGLLAPPDGADPA